MTSSAQSAPGSVSEAEAAVLAARRELAQTIDALALRLDPRVKAAEASQAARQAAADAQGVLTGKGMPQGSPARTRNLKILAGIAVGAVALVALAVARRTR